MSLWTLVISAIALSVLVVMRDIAGLRGRRFPRWAGIPVIVVLGLVSVASFFVASG